MPHHEKGQDDLGVSTSPGAPGKVTEHTVLLILPATIISTETHFLLPQSMLIEKVVKVTDHC